MPEKYGCFIQDMYDGSKTPIVCAEGKTEEFAVRVEATRYRL